MNRPRFNIRAKGIPPRSGWALRLVDNVPNTDYKSGEWVSRWDTQFEFSADLEKRQLFTPKDYADQVRAAIQADYGWSTEIVPIGNPQ